MTNAERVFFMGAMIGELRENGLSEDDIRKGIDAAFAEANKFLGDKS